MQQIVIIFHVITVLLYQTNATWFQSFEGLSEMIPAFRLYFRK